jgi:hypothetical protein
MEFDARTIFADYRVSSVVVHPSFNNELNQTTRSLHASEQQLDRLVAFMIRVQVELPSTGQDQPRSAASALQRAFASASFWEFGNLRSELVGSVHSNTRIVVC